MKPPFDRDRNSAGFSDDAVTVVKDVDTWKSSPTLRTEVNPVDPNPEPPTDEGFEERYELVDVLGEGGMGVVHLCSDHRIGRDVAMKVIREDMGQRASLRARFFREARVQGQLEHPSIVPVYDLGSTGTTAYFTMKRVNGLTLERILAGIRSGDPEMIERYSRRRLLTAFSSVCLAVAYAHSRGVVHRDLKPANIMLGDFGEVIVLDWGLAKLPEVEEPTGGRVLLPASDDPQTKAGSVLGSPGYMPPEQIRGAGSVDFKADIYALGAILFELVTFQQMHRGHTIDEIFTSTLMGTAGRPSARAPNRKIPRELDDICQRTTALDPAERPEARELHEAIEHFLDGARDDERRTALANVHAQAAQVALTKSALEDDAERGSAERSRALREVNAALALQPTHQGALATLISLLADPPRHMPPEAQAEIDQILQRDRRHSARNTAMAYGGWLLVLPFLLYSGVKSWLAVAILMGTMAVSVGWSVFMARRPRLDTWHGVVGLTLTFLSISATSVLFGPFVVLPTLGMMAFLVYLMSLRSDATLRWVVLMLAVAAVLVPVALEFSGVLPRSVTLDAHGLHITPWAVEMSGGLVVFGLVVFHVFVMVVAYQLALRSVDAFVAAERSLFLHAWQLRQLIPDEARDARVSHIEHRPDPVSSR
ncbi:MAG: protein kinase [Polyangiaceae bacterium]